MALPNENNIPKPENDDPTPGPEQTGEVDMGDFVEETPEPPKELTLEEQLAEANDRLLRMSAELDNSRKRASRELSDHRKYEGISLMRDIMPVLDNMHRAIDAAEQGHDTSHLLEGFTMVSQQLDDVLSRRQCTKIATEGEAFDPHIHEAILQQPSDEFDAGKITMTTQTGFMLHDRVVRPSQVIVSSGPAEVVEETDDITTDETEDNNE
jgi:molecular chaperone GrpE